MTFAEYIERRGDTRAFWAKRLGVSRGFLSDLVNGKRRPSLELAAQIERATEGAISASSWIPDPATTAPDDGPRAPFNKGTLA